ncbi:agmatine deiminase family protein [Lunatimonas salinarum]|uniref:agmatine deiminase family protein n=1 Tax=Lunatimonas salinarum TaxID=1774590 RepID=UPI001ADF46D0|nr:agmatine deiminase family protein [Lunatimonas salinarum]
MSSDWQQGRVGTMEFPADKGYYFPAEFAPHQATWLSWPHKEASWPGKIHTVYDPYVQFIRYVTEGEEVQLMVKDQSMEDFAKSHLIKGQVDLERIIFHHFPTNDAWCRDHGPAFLINPKAAAKKVVVNWNYNAWGDKYPPYDLDNQIPQRVADYLQLPCYHPGIVMEGGSVDFNGTGTLLTTTSCLLNPNRNPHLNQSQIEEYLYRYYGVKQILWLGDGIEGDDTDGHVDDITRFVSERTVVTVVEENKRDSNFHPLRENLKLLESFRLTDGSPLSIVELPMPSPVVYEGTRLPASYANFYIANACVVVPTFRDKNDDRALEIIQDCFPDRKVVGVDSLDIIWGLGSFHCLSQQEPMV